MRVSTFAFSRFSVNEMNRQTANLTTLQEQISSGKKLNKPSDDPAQMATVESIDASLLRLSQYDKSATLLSRRLAQEETVIENITNNLQRLKEIAIAANTSIVGEADRHALQAEAKQIREQIMDNANTRTADGEYLFSGGKSRTKPFTYLSNGVNYNGDQTQNYVKVSDSRKTRGADTGYELFMKIPEGNGYFMAEKNVSNTGTGVINTGSIVDSTGNPGGHSFEIEFTSATEFQVTDQTTGNTVLNNVPYSSGAIINFSGLNISIEGNPNVGDKFSVRPSSTQDIFSIIDTMNDTLEYAPFVAATSTEYHNRMDATLQNLNLALEHMNTMRSDVGSRLGYIENTVYENETTEVVLRETRSSIEDANLTEVISNLQYQETTLEALRATYAKVSSNSLFNFL